MSLEHSEFDKLICAFNDCITTKTSQALSTLLGEPIKHSLRIVHNGIGSIGKIPIPSDHIKMCSVRLQGNGDVHIELLYTIKRKHAITITSKLLEREVTEIDEMETSVLQEVANILTGSFLNSLSASTGFKIDLSIPSFKEGMLDDLIMEPTKEVNPTDIAIITDSLLCGTESDTKIHMFIIQHPEHARRLICSVVPNSPGIDASNFIGCENSEIDDLLVDFNSEVNQSESNSEIN
jgi:chemotaxis protein CheC